MKQLYTFLFSFLISIATTAQPTLKPSIGIGSLPNDADSICNIPTYTGSFYTSGLQTGDTMANFTLYDVNGDSLNLKETLSNNKPVLLVNGSYTCPVFRNRLSEINDVTQTYAGQLDVFIIYTVEAHPDIDVSPYSGNVWTTQQNVDENVLYEQPKTYGERKSVVSDLINDLSPLPTIYLDGPCNEWWQYFGPAPQNSYLIDTTGVVFSKHGWFNKLPDDIYCDIDSLLLDSPCAALDLNGTFVWELTDNDTIWGPPGAVLTSKGKLINNSSSDVDIEIIRMQENIPNGWQTSMCINFCLDPEMDTASVIVLAGDTQSYTMYFYSDLIENSGHARMGFRNKNNSGNQFAQNFWGITADSLVGVSHSQFTKSISLFPNPANNFITIKGAEKGALLSIYDLQGRKVRSQRIENQKVSVQNLKQGFYVYEIEVNGKLVKGKLQKL